MVVLRAIDCQQESLATNGKGREVLLSDRRERGCAKEESIPQEIELWIEHLPRLTGISRSIHLFFLKSFISHHPFHATWPGIFSAQKNMLRTQEVRTLFSE